MPIIHEIGLGTQKTFVYYTASVKMNRKGFAPFRGDKMVREAVSIRRKFLLNFIEKGVKVNASVYLETILERMCY